jgi:hypothetical protein
MIGWIYFEDDMPETEGWYLGYGRGGFTGMVYWDKDEQSFQIKENGEYKNTFVTHWMELPEPPKEG